MSEIELDGGVSGDQKLLLSRRVWLTDPTLRFSLTDYTTLEENDEDVRERACSVWGEKRNFSITSAELCEGGENINGPNLNQKEKEEVEKDSSQLQSSGTSCEQSVLCK